MKIAEKELIASYKVAKLIAQGKKAHTDVESIISPALAIIVETMLGKEAIEKVKKTTILHNDTISRKIEDLSSNLKKKLSRISNRTTVNSGHFRLMNRQISVEKIPFIRFVKDEKFLNEYLFCKDLKSKKRHSYWSL